MWLFNKHLISTDAIFVYNDVVRSARKPEVRFCRASGFLVVINGALSQFDR